MQPAEDKQPLLILFKQCLASLPVMQACDQEFSTISNYVFCLFVYVGLVVPEI